MSDALINGLAGAGGGIIAQLITYPLQTVRIWFQSLVFFSNGFLNMLKKLIFFNVIYR